MSDEQRPASLPSITAIVPTRDREELLRRACRAILQQTYEGEIELLIVFDQQEPHMLDLDVPARRSVRAISNVRSPGLAGARNSGVESATGELVAFCDDDDEWLPDKLARQTEALLGNPAASVATTGITIVRGGRTIARPLPKPVLTLDDLSRSRQMEVHSSTLLMRRDRLLGDIGLVDEEIPGSYGEDYDLILRAAARGPLVGVPDPLVRVYWNTSYFSDRWQTMIPALRYQLEKHPELHQQPRNIARMYSRIAFAHAASGDPRQARAWAKKAMRLDKTQPRIYLTYLVTWGLPAGTVQRAANALGKGV